MFVDQHSVIYYYSTNLVIPPTYHNRGQTSALFTCEHSYHSSILYVAGDSPQDQSLLQYHELTLNQSLLQYHELTLN